MFKKLFGTILLAYATTFSAAAFAQVIGYVHEVKGDVTLRDTGKQPAKAAAGDTFQQGAGVTTGADGQVTLKFEDGQLAILAPNSQFVATTYVFNKTRVADSNILFNLARGGLRFVSGMIAATNSSKFAVRTPTATAGVRGTDGNIALGADGSIMASTSNGTVTFTVGGVTVTIPPGATSIAPPNAAPSAPAPTATVAVPAALVQAANIIRQIAAQNVPNNAPSNPVAVAAAVRAAVALAQNPTNPALIAAAELANAQAIQSNQALAAAAAAAGGTLPPPPATPVIQTPGAPPPAVNQTPPPPPPVTVVVPSGS